MSKEIKVFISHSSMDVQFIRHLSVFFEQLSIYRKNIFCSSIENQGIKNNERIEETVRNKIINSDLIVYLISNEFLKSPFCIEELGAGWVLREIKRTPVFIIKLSNVDYSSIKGFINSDYKITDLTTEKLIELVDNFYEEFDIKQPSASEVNNVVKTFLSSTRQFNELKSQKNNNEKVKNINCNTNEDNFMNDIIQSFNYTANNEKIISRLSTDELKVIAAIYFEDSRYKIFDSNDVTIQMLVNKKIIHCILKSLTMEDTYNLSDWVIDYVNNNKELKNKLFVLNKPVRSGRV